MPDLSAERRLVKSPPELWAELSEVDRLARHLDAFGEIKITKLDPERRVSWEGENASGTVSIESSGWGTKVVITAAIPGVDPEPEPVESEPVIEEALAVEQKLSEPEPEPQRGPLEALASDLETREPEPPRRGRISRWLGSWRPTRPEPDAEVPEPQRDRDWLENALAGRVPMSDMVGAPPRGEVLPDPAPPAPPEPAPLPEPGPDPAPMPEPTPDPGPDPEPAPQPEPEQPVMLDRSDAQAVLDGVLDTLGAAHHRPFSRG